MADQLGYDGKYRFDIGAGHVAEATVDAPASVLLDGTLNVTTTAAPLTANATPCWIIYIQNDPTNAADIYIGSATSQSVRVTPGNGMTLSINDASKVYVKSLSGTLRVNYHGLGGG